MPPRAWGWCRDVSPTGEQIEWGRWAITGNDPDFRGTGNPDTGEDYGPAPGRASIPYVGYCEGLRCGLASCLLALR